jgi:hypothetical protein
LVKNITSGDDVKYIKVQECSLDDLDTAVVKCIDAFIKQDPNIGLKIEANKNTINMKNVRTDDKKIKDFYGFKPSFEFNEDSSKSKIAQYMHEVNYTFKKSNSMKISATKLPLLMNACCLQQLTPSSEYYTGVNVKSPSNYKYTVKNKNILYYTTTKTVKRTEIKQSEVKFQNPKIIFSKHTISTGNHFAVDDKNKVKTFIESNQVFSSDKDLHILIDNFDNNDIWNENIFIKSLDFFNASLNFIKTLGLQSYDDSKIAIFKSIVMNISDSSSLAYSIKKYMSNDLIKVTAKICNRVLISEDMLENQIDNPEVALRVSFLRNENVNIDIIQSLYLNCFKDTNKLYLKSGEIQNIILLNYIFTKYVYNVLSNIVSSNSELVIYDTIDVTLLSNVNPENMICAKMIGEYVLLLIYGILDCIMMNDENVNNVRKRVEELRENKKQDLINKYNIDDEERQLQMMLRKIGVDTWYDVGASGDKDQYVANVANDVDIMTVVNQKEENANYNMKGYQGENGDADEVDEDFASMTLFVDI